MRTAAGMLVLMIALAYLPLGADEKPKSGDEAEIPLSEATWKQVQEKVAAHKGKVVVLDAWSLSCPPCIKEFPGLVKIHEKHGKKVVACMSLACDYTGVAKKPPKFYREKVLAFLTKNKATFENFQASEAADELYTAMDIASIPAVFVYGRDGKLAKLFIDESLDPKVPSFTYKDISKLVDELVAKE